MPDIFTNHSSQQKKPDKKEPAGQSNPAPQQKTQQNAAQKIIEADGLMNAFSTFIYKPTDFSFADQEPGEVVILFLRRHIFTNFPWVVITILLLFVPFLASFVLQSIHISLDFLPARFLFLLIVFYYVIVFGYAFANFASWFYNIGLITNKRVADVDFTSLTFINVAATAVEEIEDTEFTQHGIFATFFDYGDVTSRTVAGNNEFVFEKIPHPGRVVDILSQIVGDIRND